MNQEIIETLLNWLMWISLDALLLIAAVCAYVGLRRLGKALCVRLSPVAIGVFAVAAIVATGEAQKRLLRGGPLGERALPECGALGDRALPNVTAEEIAQGWRPESVVTNDAVSYAMPTNGVEYMPWSLGGGYEAHFPLDLGEFAFPFGTNVVRRVDVVSGGMVESLPRPSCMSICAAREYASIVPGVGRFWWADTARPKSAPYQAKLLTWENVYAGRDRTGQYNAQIELCGDGNFITRSNNVERVYRRVLSHDWDNDGLPNTIDPAPETPLVPSAWNHSEDWATNGIDLVTQFVGYTLTNHVHFTVGITNEPPLAFSLGCQRVFFLNDAELGSPSNSPERIRPVTLSGKTGLTDFATTPGRPMVGPYRFAL